MAVFSRGPRVQSSIEGKRVHTQLGREGRGGEGHSESWSSTSQVSLESRRADFLWFGLPWLRVCLCLYVHALYLGISMEQLPLSRDSDGQVHLNGTGPVKICVDYREMLGSGGQGTVYRAKIFDEGGTQLLMEVRTAI